MLFGIKFLPDNLYLITLSLPSSMSIFEILSVNRSSSIFVSSLHRVNPGI